jgi:hypothetical protein
VALFILASQSFKFACSSSVEGITSNGTLLLLLRERVRPKKLQSPNCDNRVKEDTWDTTVYATLTAKRQRRAVVVAAAAAGSVEAFASLLCLQRHKAVLRATFHGCILQKNPNPSTMDEPSHDYDYAALLDLLLSMIHDHGAATINTPVVAVDIEAAKPKRQRRAAVADLRDRPVISTVAAVKDPRDDWIHLSTWSLHQYLTLDMITTQNLESLARLTQGLVYMVSNDAIKEQERSISLAVAIASCLRLLQQEAPTAPVSELVLDTLSNALASQEAAEIEVCGTSLIRSSLIPTDEAKLAVSADPPRASKTIAMTRQEWQRSILSLPSLAEILPPNSQGGLDSATLAFGIPLYLLQHAQSWLNSSATEESLYWASQYLDLAATLTKREAASSSSSDHQSWLDCWTKLGLEQHPNSISHSETKRKAKPSMSAVAETMGRAILAAHFDSAGTKSPSLPGYPLIHKMLLDLLVVTTASNATWVDRVVVDWVAQVFGHLKGPAVTSLSRLGANDHLMLFAWQVFQRVLLQQQSATASTSKGRKGPKKKADFCSTLLTAMSGAAEFDAAQLLGIFFDVLTRLLPVPVPTKATDKRKKPPQPTSEKRSKRPRLSTPMRMDDEVVVLSTPDAPSVLESTDPTVHTMTATVICQILSMLLTMTTTTLPRGTRWRDALVPQDILRLLDFACPDASSAVAEQFR